MRNSLYIFPPMFVWMHGVKDHQQIKEKYLPLIEDDVKKNGHEYRKNSFWNCDVTSSYFSKESMTFLEEDFWNNIVKIPVNEMFEKFFTKMGFAIPPATKLSNCWYNHYEKGQFQEPHSHRVINSNQKPSMLSGIYFIDNPSNNLSFVNNYTPLYSGSRDDFNHHRPKIREGDVVLFPSELLHYVTPCDTSRTTVSFNIYAEYN